MLNLQLVQDKTWHWKCDGNLHELPLLCWVPWCHAATAFQEEGQYKHHSVQLICCSYVSTTYMGWATDTLHAQMDELSRTPSEVIGEGFMMSIFCQVLQWAITISGELVFCSELSPFQENWYLVFKRKQIAVVTLKSGTKVAHFARLHTELFSPTRTADFDTT